MIGRMIIRPYGIADDNNPMNMIGHDNKFIQLRIGKMGGNIHPTFTGVLSGIIQLHFIINDFPEQTITVLRTDRYKICAPSGIIVPAQSDGTSADIMRHLWHPKCCIKSQTHNSG